MKTKKQISDALHEIIYADIDMSISELCRKTKLNRKAIYSVLQKKNYKIDTLLKIMEGLGINIEIVELPQ